MVAVKVEDGVREYRSVAVSVGSVAVRVGGLGVRLGSSVSVMVGMRVIVPVLVGVHNVLSKTAVSVNAEMVGNLTTTGGIWVEVDKLQPASPTNETSATKRQKRGKNFTFIN